MDKDPVRQEGPEQSGAWMNIWKTVLLVVILIAAWFVLEWLMGRK